MIEREKKFNIGEKSFTVKFPNVGQMIDIESLKQALTSNRYGVMVSSGVKSMYLALDIVDTIAFFQVCIPSLGKFYNITNFANVQYDEIKDMVDTYINQIKPWYDEVLKELYSNGNETDKRE